MVISDLNEFCSILKRIYTYLFKCDLYDKNYILVASVTVYKHNPKLFLYIKTITNANLLTLNPQQGNCTF